LLPIIDTYAEAMQNRLFGFSPAAAGFVRFSVALDASTLPADPMAARAATSSVQLIDIDASSPVRGERQRVSLHLRGEPGVYWPSNTLAFMPTLGFPLRPGVRYALVVTDQVRAVGGGRIAPSPDLSRVLGLTAASGPTEAAKRELADALNAVVLAGVARERIIQLAVFTTNDPVGELEKIRDWV